MSPPEGCEAVISVDKVLVHQVTPSNVSSSDQSDEDEAETTLCYLLKLPREVRNIIFCYLFVCPYAIAPFFIPNIQYQRRKRSSDYYPEYWMHPQVMQFLCSYSQYTKLLGILHTSRNQLPQALRLTADRQSNLDNSTVLDHLRKSVKLPHWYYENVDRQASAHIPSWKQFQHWITIQADNQGPRIQGLALLRTFKKLQDEGTESLYGDNTFSFQRRNASWKLMSASELNVKPNLIPGLTTEGQIMLQEQTGRAIDKMFSRKRAAPFVYKESLLWFMRTIGRHNASKITKIKIQGYFKTATEDRAISLGMAHTLHIQTIVMGYVCADLRELTIQPLRPDRGYFDNDLRGQRSDLDHIDECIRNVVATLPALKKLQLGNSKFGDENKDVDWGDTLKWKWEKIVRDGSFDADVFPPREYLEIEGRTPSLSWVREELKRSQEMEESMYEGLTLLLDF